MINNNQCAESKSESDSDEYIDLSTNLQDTSENIYQFTISDEQLILKNIGKFSIVPEIIIMENFGPDSNLSLYNCVYIQDELDEHSDNTEMIFPLIKLVKTNKIPEQNPEQILDDVAFIGIKLDKFTKSDTQIENWSLYWIGNTHNCEHVKLLKLDKNINSSNMVEKIISYSIDMGFL
jgi:hypothetical protein